MRRLLLMLAGLLALATALAGCVPADLQSTAPNAGSSPDGSSSVAHQQPVTLVMPGDDWGYPSPFAFYLRGPGYLRMSYLFDTLVWKDEQGIIPWLAEEWEMSPDGLTWTFRLRDDARWHDGQPLTAEDVVFTFDYFRDKYAQGMVKWSWPLGQIDRAEVANEGRAVVVHLAAPTAGLLTDLFASLPIIPQHIWADVEDPLRKLDEEAVIGSSLFRLREYSKEEGRYVYEANPDFFLGQPLVDELIFIKVKDPALALLAGDVEEASFSGKAVASVRQLEGNSAFQVLEGPGYWTLKLYFNTTRAPLDQQAVRQAIAYAIDRQGIVDKAQMGGAVVASTGILSPGTYWHQPNLPTYLHDAAKAQELLSAAGVGPFEATLLTTETYVRDAELIKNDLQPLGIGVTVKTADMATVDSLLKEGNFDLLITGHGGTANPDMGDPVPECAWSSSAYSEAYARSLRAADDAERREQVWLMQEIIAEELPALALWHPLMWEVYRPGKAYPFYTADGVANGIPTANNKLMFLARGE